jgi:hypothetical protein
MFAGAISDIYNGTTLDAMPIPIPPNTLDAITHDKDGIKAQPIADNRNNVADNNKGFLLPNRSLNSPEKATPIIQPTSAADTNQPSCTGLRLNCFSTKGNTPEITAISKPNRKPPSEATMVIVLKLMLLSFIILVLVIGYLNYFVGADIDGGASPGLLPQFIFGLGPITNTSEPPFTTSW